MKSYLVGVPLLCLAAVAQSTILSGFHFYGGTVDLVLLMVLGWTLTGDVLGGLGWGFVGGLCLDLLSGGPLGAAPLGLTLMAYLAGLTEGRFWGSHLVLPLGMALLGTFGFHLVSLVTFALSGYAIDWGSSLARIVLPSALLNTVLMWPVFSAMRWVHTQLYPAAVAA
jgi:rod shape-determining protein MreD